MDRTEGGANIERIREIIEEHLAQINPEDLVVIEGGGNGLMNVGEQKTITVISEMMKKLKEKVKTNPLIMCIPMRHRVERTVYEEKRRKLNRKCIENLESWGCDGLHLWENMKWEEVWARDGIHMSNLGKVWVAWNLAEWAQSHETKDIEKDE